MRFLSLTDPVGGNFATARSVPISSYRRWQAIYKAKFLPAPLPRQIFKQKVTSADRHKPIGDNVMFLILNRVGHQILFNHQRHFKDDGIVKLPKIQTSETFDFFQTID